MGDYLRFTEENDWEGETWNFYIPIENNEAALSHLRTLIEGQNQYELGTEPFSKKTVKTLDRNSRVEYMALENRLSGILLLPDRIDWENDDPFYKGGISEFLHPKM